MSENEIKKDPVVAAVQQRTRALPNLEAVTRQLHTNSVHEYGTLSLRLEGVEKEVATIRARREEVRQHIAALEASLQVAEKANAA